MNHSQPRTSAVLRSPVFWGGLVYTIFHILWSQGVIKSGFVLRYCAGHPVEYVETALFLVGMASLAIKALDIFGQYGSVATPLLRPPLPGGTPVAEATCLLADLEDLPEGGRQHLLVRRLRLALLHVERSNSAEKLDEELKYLADEEADRAYASYGLVRSVIWAIPILGFLGTVIGIALAMGKLSPQELETSLPSVMAGLMVAFDTTAVALAFSMILYFTQFAVERWEQRFLEAVDSLASAELLGRFERIPNTPDGEVAAVRKSLQAILQSYEETTARQAEAWRRSIEAAAANWQQVQSGIEQSVASAAGLQQNMTRQAEMLHRAIEAVGDVARLETELNRNLAALAGARNFEQTVISLAAAIHLLNARLGREPGDAPWVSLEPKPRKGQAA